MQNKIFQSELFTSLSRVSVSCPSTKLSEAPSCSLIMVSATAKRHLFSYLHISSSKFWPESPGLLTHSRKSRRLTLVAIGTRAITVTIDTPLHSTMWWRFWELLSVCLREVSIQKVPKQIAAAFKNFCAYQAGTLRFEKRERLIDSEKVKMYI